MLLKALLRVSPRALLRGLPGGLADMFVQRLTRDALRRQHECQV